MNNYLAAYSNSAIFLMLVWCVLIFIQFPLLTADTFTPKLIITLLVIISTISILLIPRRKTIVDLIKRTHLINRNPSFDYFIMAVIFYIVILIYNIILLNYTIPKLGLAQHSAQLISWALPGSILSFLFLYTIFYHIIKWRTEKSSFKYTLLNTAVQIFLVYIINFIVEAATS